MINLTGLIGVFVLLGIAFLLSNNRKEIKFNTIIWGIGLQLLLAVLLLKVPLIKSQFFGPQFFQLRHKRFFLIDVL